MPGTGYPGVVRRFPLAPLLVGVVVLLAAGGALLGAFQAPTGTDLAVHNGVGETLQANRVVGTYKTSAAPGTVVSFDYTAPDHIAEEAVGADGHVEGRRDVTTPEASEVLGPVRELLSVGSFAPRGGYYESTQPASELVTPAERAAVSGTYRARVQLESGYVVAVSLRIDARDGSQRIDETVEYTLSRVGGWTRARSRAGDGAR